MCVRVCLLLLLPLFFFCIFFFSFSLFFLFRMNRTSQDWQSRIESPSYYQEEELSNGH